MANNRTFKFFGQGYGSSSVSITAKINNTVVYSGEIPTLDQIPVLPVDGHSLVTVFSIDNSSLLNTDFAGSLPMTITVNGGNSAMFGRIESNYYAGYVSKPYNETAAYQVDSGCSYNDNFYKCIQACTGVLPTDSAYWSLQDPAAPNYPGTIDHFFRCYNGIPTNSEGTEDTRNSVYIDGVQQVPPLNKSPGSTLWEIPSGSTLTYNWNISAGQVDNVIGSGNAVANFD